MRCAVAAVIASLWWVPEAAAQEERCTPWPRHRLVEVLDAVDAAFSEMDVVEAEVGLEIVDERLRCLDRVVRVSDLARYTRSKAVFLLLRRDDVQALHWARTWALTDPELPWPAPFTADNRLRRRLENLVIDEGPPGTIVPEAPGWVVERGGGVFVNGRPSAAPSAHEETPQFVQRVDRRGATEHAWWQDGGQFRDGSLGPDPTPAPPALPPEDLAAVHAGWVARGWSAATPLEGWADDPGPVAVAEPPAEPARKPRPERPPREPRVRAVARTSPVVPFATGAGAAVLSGLFLALSAVDNAALRNGRADDSVGFQGRVYRTNAFAATGIAFGAGAAGMFGWGASTLVTEGASVKVSVKF